MIENFRTLCVKQETKIKKDFVNIALLHDRKL